MIHRVAVISLLLFSLVGTAEAVVVDFEDLTSGTLYSVGNMFTSGGVSFNVIGYNGPGSSINVTKILTPMNTRISMNNRIGVNVALPPNVNFLAFDYSDGCSSCSHTGITVNGAASSPAIQLVGRDGTTVGGATIFIGPPIDLSFQNRLTLKGAISTFAVGGTELYFDNLEIVPEPATLLLAMTGLFVPTRRRRAPLATVSADC
jgi:hypothetical protein